MVAMCGTKCPQPQVFGMHCHQACAKPEGHSGPCMCRWCWTAAMAMRVLDQQAKARREMKAVEQLVFAREEQVRQHGARRTVRSRR